jgi:hypothetical protein
MFWSGALSSILSYDSVGTGWGFRFGGLTVGEAGHSASNFCLTAQLRAVRTNCSRTLTVLSWMVPPLMPF